MINNLFLLFFFFFSALAACCRSIFRCQGSGGNFQSVIGRQAKRSVVGRAMKLFPRTRISQTSPCTDGETIRLLTKKQLYHHLEGFPSRSSTSVFFESVSIWRCLMCVSQSDKALVLVDISHHISTSQLEEPVHSVICQQVLRLCQMQRYKRQSSNRGNPETKWWTESELTGGVPSPTEPSTAASLDVPLADVSTRQLLSARGWPVREKLRIQTWLNLWKETSAPTLIPAQKNLILLFPPGHLKPLQIRDWITFLCAWYDASTGS